MGHRKVKHAFIKHEALKLLGGSACRKVEVEELVKSKDLAKTGDSEVEMKVERLGRNRKTPRQR